MLLFPAYAVLIWYFCVRFRRQVWGFVALAFGLTIVATLATLQRRLFHTRNTDSFLFTHLDFLLWVEFVAIGSVGLFLACLPRTTAEVPCRKCGYELLGLDDTNPTCPECGLGNAAQKPKRMTCGVCGARSEVDPRDPRCAACDGAEDSRGVAAV